MGSRTESRAIGAIAKLQTEGALDGKGQVEYIPLDISTPSQAEYGAKEVMRRTDRLDLMGEPEFRCHSCRMLTSFSYISK